MCLTGTTYHQPVLVLRFGTEHTRGESLPVLYTLGRVSSPPFRDDESLLYSVGALGEGSNQSSVRATCTYKNVIAKFLVSPAAAVTKP